MNSLALFRLVFLGAALFCMRAATVLGEPYNVAPFVVPGRFEAEEFDRGGEGIGYHSVGPLLLTNISFQAEGLVTNVFPLIPRERPGADIGVADGRLALRTGEWVNYTISNRVAGYYLVHLNTQGPVSYIAERNGCWGNREVTGAAPVLRYSLDGDDHGFQTVATNHLCLQRIWLSEGLHELRIEAHWVDELHLAACGADRDNCLFQAWRFSSLMIDWLELAPAPPPLVTQRLAGSPKPFADGVGLDASWSNGLLIGETPTGDLLALDAKSIRVIGRDGTVRTLAGNPLNPQRTGVGTNAGFGTIINTAVTPAGGVLVVQAGNETNSTIFRVEPSGVVGGWFEGGVRHPRASNLCYNTNSGWGDCPLVAIAHLVVMDDESIVAWGDYDSSTYCTSAIVIPRRESVSYSTSVHAPTSMTLRSVTAGALTFDPKPVGPGYRLVGDVLEQETLPGFFLPVATGLSSAYRAKDGTLWGSDRSAVYRLFPGTNGSYLLATGLPHGTVEGVPSRLVFPDETISLRARGSGPFWKFARWSDGNTNNPRTLSITRDTNLRAEFEYRLPNPQGIRAATFRKASATHLRFEVIGSDDYSMPYQYRIEASADLKVWNSVNSAAVLDATGEFSSGIVTARRPATVVQIPLPGTNRYYRASLIAN